MRCRILVSSEHGSAVLQPSQVSFRMENLRVADEHSEDILVPSRARSELDDVFSIDTLLPRYLSVHLLTRV